jgi:hypothetical protein
MGVVPRELPRRLLLPRAVDEDDLLVAALRLDEPLLALRFALPLERPPVADCWRLELALRAALDAPAADRPRDFLLLVPDLLPLRDDARLLDFPRDFLALVAIDGLLGVVDEKCTSTIARIRHIRKSSVIARVSLACASGRIG